MLAAAAPLPAMRLNGARPMSRSATVSALLAAAVTAAAFVFNPTADQHRDRIKASIAERHPVAGALGIGALAAITSAYHSLGVASYTTFDGRWVSVGALGQVVVLERDER